MIKAIAVAFLCVLSIGLFNSDTRYDTISNKVLSNLDFSQKSKHWTAYGSSATIRYSDPPILRLTNRAEKQTLISQSLKLPVAYKFLRIGADIQQSNIVAGPMWWQRTGLIMVSFDGQGRRMPYWPWKIALLDGTGNWQRYEAVIPVSPDASRMTLTIFIESSSGEANFRNITVDGLVHSDWFSVIYFALIAAWAMAAIWIIGPLFMRHWKRLPAILALGVFLCMLGGILAPQPGLSIFLGDVRSLFDKSAALVFAPDTPQKRISKPDAPLSNTRQDITDLIPPEGPPETTSTTARVIAAMPQSVTSDGGAPMAHFATHALLAFLVTLVCRGSPPVWLLSCLLLTGVATELIQYFVVTRSVNLGDGSMNVAGAASGYLLALAWTIMVRRLNHVPAA